MKVFKQLRDELRRDGVGFDADTPLVQGDTIEERVFKGAKVDLGKKSDAKLTLSLWYDKPEAQKAKPLLAEISFTYDPGESEEAAQAARRASKLLVAMQGLDGWALPEAEKTAMALTDTCKAGGA